MASVWKRENSKYYWACWTGPDGKRHKRSTKQTNKRAALKIAYQWEEVHRRRMSEAQVRRVMSDIVEDLEGEALLSVSVRDYAKRQIAAKRGTVKPSTFKKYEHSWMEFADTIGSRADDDIGRVTPAMIANYRDQLAERIRASTVNAKLKAVRVLFRQAWKDGVISDDPAAKVPILKVSATRDESRRPFAPDELRRLLEVAKEEWRGMILVGLYSGMRLGDIARLTWREVDLVSGTLNAVAQKTGRRVMLPLAKPLADHLGTLAGDDPAAALFPTRQALLGQDGHTGALSNEFHDLMAEAGLVTKRANKRAKADGNGRSGRRAVNPLTFHSLRHNTVSLLSEAGVSVRIVQEIVGHDSEVVNRRYTHISAEALADAISKLPEV